MVPAGAGAPSQLLGRIDVAALVERYLEIGHGAGNDFPDESTRPGWVTSRKCRLPPPAGMSNGEMSGMSPPDSTRRRCRGCEGGTSGGVGDDLHAALGPWSGTSMRAVYQTLSAAPLTEYVAARPIHLGASMPFSFTVSA